MIRDQIQVQRDHSESAGPLVTALARVTKLRHCDAACLQCMMIPVPRARPGPAAGDLGYGLRVGGLPGPAGAAGDSVITITRRHPEPESTGNSELDPSPTQT